MAKLLNLLVFPIFLASLFQLSLAEEPDGFVEKPFEHWLFKFHDGSAVIHNKAKHKIGDGYTLTIVRCHAPIIKGIKLTQKSNFFCEIEKINDTYLTTWELVGPDRYKGSIDLKVNNSFNLYATSELVLMPNDSYQMTTKIKGAGRVVERGELNEDGNITKEQIVYNVHGDIILERQSLDVRVEKAPD